MQPLLASLFDETERLPLSVSELTTSIRSSLEKSFATVWVEGEISNFHKHSSGHWYFTLKGRAGQLRGVCYRSSNQRIRFRPEDGLLVRARGRLTVYEPKGEYQLISETLEPVGAGALQLAFEQTKARLQAEGLFAAELKRHSFLSAPHRYCHLGHRRRHPRHPQRDLAPHPHSACFICSRASTGRRRCT